jgi:hypothetical protein
MAKPDCDDGWLKYAHELDAALAVSDFSKKARLVLRVVFEQIYGPDKLPLATLSPTAIGKAFGRSKQYVEKGISEAVRSKALERVGLRGFRFLKDYEKWVEVEADTDPEPRFTPAELRWIKDSPKRSRSYIDPLTASPDLGTDQRTSVPINGDESPDTGTHQNGSVPILGDESNQNRGRKYPDLGTDQQAPISPPRPPIGEPARGIELREKREATTDGGGAREDRTLKANSQTPPKTPAPAPPRDRGQGTEPDCWPEAEVERVVKAARESWDELVAYEVKANYLLYDPECLYRAVVDPVADRDAIKNRVGFIFSRARKYEDMGGPPPDVEVKAKVQPNSKSPNSPLSRLPEYQVVPESIIPRQPACKPGESDEVLRQFGIHVERFAHLRPKERPRRPIPVRDLNRPQAS